MQKKTPLQAAELKQLASMMENKHNQGIGTSVKVRFLGKGSKLSLQNGKVYDARILQRGWYGIVDETDEEYAYPPNHFEVVKSDDARMIAEYVGDTYRVSLRKGKKYKTKGLDQGLYIIKDETGETFGFPASEFVVVQGLTTNDITLDNTALYPSKPKD